MNMTLDDVRQQVKRVAAERYSIREDQLTHDAQWDELGLDSLDQVELAMSLEDSFGVDINDETLSRMKTFGETVSELFALTRSA